MREEIEGVDYRAITELYCDGGVVGKNPSDVGGTWAFCAVYENGELAFSQSGFHKTEGQKTTNNHTEYIAATYALEAMPMWWSGTLHSDSQVTLGRLFDGWKNKNLPEEYVTRAKAALKRLGIVEGKHLDGHPTKAQLETGIGKRGNPVSKWNVLCDKLCNEESAKAKESHGNETYKIS